MMKVKKAVITAAGYGTRFLPATKNVPKELLPIINKPTIHYIVEQCVEAGIEDIIIVTRFGNHSVEDYFDSSPALEGYLKKKGKDKLAEEMRELYLSANFIFVRQKQNLPYGNAAPLYTVKDLVGDDPFIFSWGDDIILGKGAGVKEVVDLYESDPCDVVLTCVETTKEEVCRIGAAVEVEGPKKKVVSIVEKPPLEECKSNLLSVSPYLFTPKIFDYLNPEVDEKIGEFIVQSAINKVVADGDVRVNVTSGEFLTTGNPLDYLKTTVEVALDRDDLRDDFLAYLKEKVK